MRSARHDARILIALALLLPQWAWADQELPAAGPLPDLSSASFAPLESAEAEEGGSGIGTAIAMEQLEDYRGGTQVNNMMETDGVLSNTTAINVATGANVITDGAFAHASGLPIVIQNSGANVLIQNSTIVNVQFK